jgi:hypothetical protein
MGFWRSAGPIRCRPRYREERSGSDSRGGKGRAHPCIINGHDYGELLYSLGVMGWFMLVTIPGGLVAFVSWLIFLILHRVA